MTKHALLATLILAAAISTISCTQFQPTPRTARQTDNRLSALELEAYPTINCIGVTWQVKGDANANATGKIEYRESGRGGEWKQALPMARSPYRENPEVKFLDGLDKWVPSFAAYARDRFHQNYLGGSLFNLKPGTRYEVKVTLTDPDGGGQSKTATVTTRDLPGIGDKAKLQGLRVGGSRDSLKNHLASAKPGSVLVVAPGTYDGDIKITANNIQVIATGEVLIDGGDAPNNDKTNGITVTGENVRISGLSFKNFHTCIKAEKSAKNLVVTNCKMNHFYNGITTDADDGYIADNSLRESYHSLDMSISGGNRKSCHGIQAGRQSRGNVICYNEISIVSDALHAIGRDNDVHNNDVIFCIDDAIEFDFGGPNNRLWQNRFSYPGENGISFQPLIGGPVYVIQNLVFGMKENPLKNRYESENEFFINNTLIALDGNGNDLRYPAYTRNNLFLCTPGKGKITARIGPDKLVKYDMDYDGFGPVGPNGKPVGQFAAETGLEKHGKQFAGNEQVLKTPPMINKAYHGEHWTAPKATLEEKGRPHPDLSLKAGSPAIGAGVRVPNIIDRDNPDLGALQHDQPMPHFGPRR